MIKTLAAQIKEFKKDSVLTPIFMILEVLFETMIPFLMASIIDKGVETETSGISARWELQWQCWRFADFGQV